MRIARTLAHVALELHRQGSTEQAERIWQEAKGIFERELRLTNSNQTA